MTSSLRDKSRKVLLCERKLLSSAVNDKKLNAKVVEVSKLKVEKSALIEKLKRSAKVKKEIRDSLSADYKLLFKTNNLKYSGIVNEIKLQVENQKFVISGDEDRLRNVQIEVTSLQDKAKHMMKLLP